MIQLSNVLTITWDEFGTKSELQGIACKNWHIALSVERDKKSKT